MMRRLVGALALAVVATTGAKAQFQANLTFGYNGDAVDYAGYYGTFDGTATDAMTGRVAGTPFQLFCADEYHFAHNGTAYDVWVTPISSSDFSHTREVINFGHTNADAQNLYFNAAALASSMTQVAVEPTTNGANDNAANANLQFAIWDVLGYAGDGPCTGSGTPNASCLQNQDPHGFFNASTVSSDESNDTPAATGISANQWLVITAFDLRTNNWQEFIYNGPGRPKESVPEPGTMGLLATGLVGMMGAGMRRRKNRK